MPTLYADRANTRTAAFNDAFAEIGSGIGTSKPRSTLNTEPVAWEFHVASHLARIATARKVKAHAAAVKAGVIFDHEKAPLAVGTNKLVYAGEVIEISVAVTSPSEKLDAPAFIADLEKSGIARKLLDKLVAKHTSESRAPHKFTSSLLTG